MGLSVRETHRRTSNRLRKRIGFPDKKHTTREAVLRIQIIAIGAFVATIFAGTAIAQTPRLITEEMMVKSSDPGLEIYVRNKRPADMTSFRPERTVLSFMGRLIRQKRRLT
jgi:hypothetical protein